MQLTAVRTLTSLPGAPALQSSVSGATANLSWTAPATTGQSVVAGFRLYKAPALGGPYSQLGANLPPTQFSLADPLSATQFYRIEAFDQFVTGASSPIISCSPAVSAGNVPPNVTMTLQGQDVANSNINISHTAIIPTNPNRTDIAWGAVAGATGYKVYRAAPPYSSYSLVGSPSSNSYSDTNATLSVNGTQGAGPQYYTANSYRYRVSSLVGGVESQQSTGLAFTIYSNGQFNWGGDFSYPAGGVTVDYTDTTGNPQGCIKFSWNAGAGSGFQPFAGNLVTYWNQWVGAFDYLEFDLKATIANALFEIHALRVGDQPINTAQGGQVFLPLANYGTPLLNQFVHFRIPLVDLLTDRGPTGTSTPVRQDAMYKFAITEQSGRSIGSLFMNNIQLTLGTSLATKYVRLDGVSPDGKPTYTTWQAAVNAAVPGDIIQIQQVSQGNPNAWDFFNIQGANACDISRLVTIGCTPTNRVVIQIRPGDYIRISSNLYILTGQGAGNAYFTLDARQCGGFKMGVSDLPQGTGWWFDVNNGSCLPNTAPQMGFNFYNGFNGVELLGPGVDFTKPNGSRSRFVIYGARNYTANLADGSTKDFRMSGVEAYLHGNISVWNTVQLQYVNAGNLLDIGSVGAIIEDCAINLGGHDALSVDGAQIILRNVQCGQDWSNVPGGPVRTLSPSNTPPGGAGTLNTWIGCRCASIQPNWRSTGSPNGGSGGNGNTAWGTPYGNIFLLNFTFNDANKAGGVQVDVTMTKFDGPEIVGYGVGFLDNPVGWAYTKSTLAANSTTDQLDSYCRLFNSVAVNVAGWTRWTIGGLNASWVVLPTDYENNRDEGNILFGMSGKNGSNAVFNLLTAGQLSATGGLTLAQSPAFGGGTWPTWWKGGTFANNFVMAAASTVAGWDQITLFSGPNNGTAAFDSPLSAWSASVFGNVRITTGSGANRIDFVNVGSAPNRQASGLKLAATSTLGIGTHPPHAKVTQNSSGTTLFASDVRFIAVCDTAGRDSSFLPYNTHLPYIAVGTTAAAAASNIAKALRIDRVAGTITLAAPLPNGATTGQGIWFANSDANGGPNVWDSYGVVQ